MTSRKKSKKPKVFFDFDNTITTFDVFDSIIGRFAKDDSWKAIEERWKKGEIGSKDCLKGQLETVRVGKNKLDRHLNKVRIDPYFKKILALLKSKKIKIFVLSDNFDYILQKILRRHRISGLDVFSNRIRLSGNRLIPGFPLSNPACGDCGHCKKMSMRHLAGAAARTFYVGDGLSDRCASKAADTVFAKGDLRKYLKKEGVKHIPFDGLKDVYDYFKEKLP